MLIAFEYLQLGLISFQQPWINFCLAQINMLTDELAIGVFFIIGQQDNELITTADFFVCNCNFSACILLLLNGLTTKRKGQECSFCMFLHIVPL